MLHFSFLLLFLPCGGVRCGRELQNPRRLKSPDLSNGVEDIADVSRGRFVPLSEGQRVGIQSTLDGLGLGPGQGGQQHRFVHILAVLADEGGQAGVGQPLLLLFAF